jgi:hypothetical protein
MAKLSRSQLKSLIKECLVEVLIEGLNPGSNVSSLQEAATPRKRSSRPSKKSPRPALDNTNFNQRINELSNVCTDDPILGNILADTARTTLQEQLGEEKQTGHMRQVSVNGDQAAKDAATSDPVDMFGDAANNWAALAFNEV